MNILEYSGEFSGTVKIMKKHAGIVGSLQEQGGTLGIIHLFQSLYLIDFFCDITKQNVFLPMKKP